MTPDDDEIRSRLYVDSARIGPSAPAPVVFAQLRPRLRRARRLRRAVIGATGVVLVGATAAALQVGLDDRSSTIRTFDETGRNPEVDPRTTDPGRTDGRADSSDPVRSSPSTIAATTAIADSSPSSSAPVAAGPGIDVPAAPIPGPTVPPVVDVTEPATSTSPAAADPTWTPYRIDSVCGNVVVRFVEDRVELVEVLANPGFSVDVKNDGPEAVEVGLHGGDDECELKADVDDGQLVTSVEGPESDEPGDGDGVDDGFDDTHDDQDDEVDDHDDDRVDEHDADEVDDG